MANEFIIKNGFRSQGNSEVTGSLNVTGGITGSLFGTASWAQNAVTASYVQIAQTASYILQAVSASFASTASYALNAGGSGLGYAIVSGSVTASVDVGADIFLIKSASSTFFTINSQGATTISSSAQNIFTIKGANNHQKLAVSQSGILVLATHSMDPTGFAPVGAIYLTSSSLWVGLD